ncbi:MULTISPECIES: zf-HC2 domain-containing protein [unclassified Streptomyces]|uniref:anti-sigma factor family protein n=1 Tax=unclassified Streptomyces TaxID=2593676 RepID=UPI00336A639B
MTAQAHHAGHDAVGAYVLGVLDDADATYFEQHLAGCEQCGRRLDELAGLEPMLAELASDVPGIHGAPGRPGLTGVPHSFTATPNGIDTLTASPGPGLLDRMIGEVAVVRRRRRRRHLSLVAAAAVLIIGGPLGAVALTSDDGSSTTVTAGTTASEIFEKSPTKVEATDPDTKVSAAIALEDKKWGTDAMLRLKNVKGPLACSLIAVPKSGEKQVMTTWSVPPQGYGIADSPDKSAQAPLFTQGGAAYKLADIDHFEIRTLDGKLLVSVKV